MKWQASLEADDDLIEGRDYIRGDNDVAARAFLNAAFETFDLLGDFRKWDLAHDSGQRNFAISGFS